MTEPASWTVESELHFTIWFLPKENESIAYQLNMLDDEGEEQDVYTGTLRGCANWLEELCDIEDGEPEEVFCEKCGKYG